MNKYNALFYIVTYNTIMEPIKDKLDPYSPPGSTDILKSFIYNQTIINIFEKLHNYEGCNDRCVLFSKDSDHCCIITKIYYIYKRSRYK